MKTNLIHFSGRPALSGITNRSWRTPMMKAPYSNPCYRCNAVYHLKCLGRRMGHLLFEKFDPVLVLGLRYAWSQDHWWAGQHMAASHRCQQRHARLWMDSTLHDEPMSNADDRAKQ